MEPREEHTPERIELRKIGPAVGGGSGAGGASDPIDVGEFRQGSPLSQWALARYLVGRAIAESVGSSLLIVTLVIFVGAGLLWWAEHPVWAVLLAILGLAVLSMRALLRAILRRVSGAAQFRPIEERLGALVRDTRSDVLRELRRIRLPSHVVTLPLLALRMLGRTRRKNTLTRMREFRLDNVVPAARLDELHLLLRTAVGRAPQARGPGEG